MVLKTEIHAQRPPRSETFKNIRASLERTQKEMSVALGISEKTVQSYEQGWRNVPTRVMIQLLVLLALYRRKTMDEVPCWEIRKCGTEQREKCASFLVGRGQFCWFIGATENRPKPKTDGTEPVLPCMECPVVKRLLSGPSGWGNEHTTQSEREEE